MDERMRANTFEHYRKSLRAHGPTPRGLDWNSRDAQEVRFRQFLTLFQGSTVLPLNDFGCGFGSLATYLQTNGYHITYHGFDICPEMIAAAREIYQDVANCDFCCDLGDLSQADYTVASGIFHVKSDASDEAWQEYVLTTLHEFDRLSEKGFAFNALTSYSDADRMRPDLYYADPCRLFDYCKTHFSRNVALLHDYEYLRLYNSGAQVTDAVKSRLATLSHRGRLRATGLPAFAFVCLPAIILLLIDLWPVVMKAWLPASYDMEFVNYPLAVVEHLALSNLTIPFWNPFASAGVPLLADPGPGLLYPVNIATSALVSPADALRISIILHILIAYGATYAFLRTLGVRRLGSVLAAMTYAFQGYILYQMNWPGILASMALFPVVLLFLEHSLRASNRRQSIRWATGSGVVFGFLLFNSSQHAFYVGLVVAGYIAADAVVRATRARGDGGLKMLRSASGAALIGLVVVTVGTGVFAAQLLPSLEFLSLSNYSSNYVRDVSGGLHFQDFAGYFYLYKGNVSSGLVPFISPYLLTLGGFALVFRRSRTTAFFGITTLVSLVLAFQLPSDVQNILLKIPGFTQFGAHEPNRILFVSLFGLSVLGGIGVDHLFSPPAADGHGREYALVAGGLVLALAVPAVGHLAPIGDPRYFVLFVFLPIAVILAQSFRVLSPVFAQVAFLGLVAGELVWGFDLHHVQFGDLTAHFNSSATATIVEKQNARAMGRVVGLDPSQPWSGYDFARCRFQSDNWKLRLDLRLAGRPRLQPTTLAALLGLP